MTGILLLLVVVLLGVAWYHGRGPGTRRDALSALALGATGMAFVAWAAWMGHAPGNDELPEEGTVAFAIAMDLSPSMLARPAPSGSESVPARFERARQVLDEVIDGLEEARGHHLVAVTGFAGEAGILIGWHDNLAEVGDVVDYSLTPELFADNGTSLDAAARSVNALFDMLPPRFANARRVVLFVSDGEDTVRASDVRYAVQRLERSGADIIAMHVGMPERNEGIPVYNDLGEFRGFRVLSGKRYSRPDQEAMRAIAGVRDGLFVRAEDPAAPLRILEQALPARRGSGADTELIPILGLFVLTAVSMLRVIL